VATKGYWPNKPARGTLLLEEALLVGGAPLLGVEVQLRIAIYGEAGFGGKPPARSEGKRKAKRGGGTFSSPASMWAALVFLRSMLKVRDRSRGETGAGEDEDEDEEEEEPS